MTNCNLDEHSFDTIRFPILYYDLDYKYPEYKILDSRILYIYVIENYEEILIGSRADLKKWIRLIDSHGNEYSVTYSNRLRANVPNEKIRQFALIDLISFVKPALKHLNQDERKIIVTSSSIDQLFINLLSNCQ